MVLYSESDNFGLKYDSHSSSSGIFSSVRVQDVTVLKATYRVHVKVIYIKLETSLERFAVKLHTLYARNRRKPNCQNVKSKIPDDYKQR